MVQTVLTVLLLVLPLLGCSANLKPLPEIDTVIDKAVSGDDDSLALLVMYFSSPVEGEAEKAMKALLEAGDRSVVGLVDALENEDLRIAESAAGALGNIKDERAVAPLIEALSREKFPKYVAIWALGEIGSEEAVDALVRHLGHENMEVRKCATRALIKFGSRAVPAVIKVLDNPDPHARRYAARVLGQSKDRRAVGPLVDRYHLLDPEVALWALGMTGASEGFPLISDEVGNSEWRVRLAAVQALGKVKDERAVPLLDKALDDPEWVVREWAARSLEEITKTRQRYRDQYGAMVVPYNLYR